MKHYPLPLPAYAVALFNTAMAYVENPAPERLNGLDYMLSVFDANAPRLPNGDFLAQKPIGLGGDAE
jgi:hypothetical protein